MARTQTRGVRAYVSTANERYENNRVIYCVTAEYILLIFSVARTLFRGKYVTTSHLTVGVKKNTKGAHVYRGRNNVTVVVAAHGGIPVTATIPRHREPGRDGNFFLVRGARDPPADTIYRPLPPRASSTDGLHAWLRPTVATDVRLIFRRITRTTIWHR